MFVRQARSVVEGRAGPERRCGPRPGRAMRLPSTSTNPGRSPSRSPPPPRESRAPATSSTASIIRSRSSRLCCFNFQPGAERIFPFERAAFPDIRLSLSHRDGPSAYAIRQSPYESVMVTNSHHTRPGAPLTFQDPPCGNRLLVALHGPHPGHLARPPQALQQPPHPKTSRETLNRSSISAATRATAHRWPCRPNAAVPPVEGPPAPAPDQRSRRHCAPRPGPERAPTTAITPVPGAAAPPPAPSPRARPRPAPDASPVRTDPPPPAADAAPDQLDPAIGEFESPCIRCAAHIGRQTGRQRSVPATHFIDGGWHFLVAKQAGAPDLDDRRAVGRGPPDVPTAPFRQY